MKRRCSLLAAEANKNCFDSAQSAIWSYPLSQIDKPATILGMSMTKADIVRAFQDTLSSAAIQLTDDGYEVIGKWCRIIRHDTGIWDIWIIATKQKITYLLKKLPTEWEFKVVEGEAWCWVKSAKEIKPYLSCLGIKSKRRVSEATKRKLKERMREVREVTANGC